MTSRDLETSKPWPRYIWASISQNPLEIQCQYQWINYRKWGAGNQMVTWPMTSRDPEKSRPWPRYIWASISQNPLETECKCQWNTYKKWTVGKRMVTWPMTSRFVTWFKIIPNHHFLHNTLMLFQVIDQRRRPLTPLSFSNSTLISRTDNYERMQNNCDFCEILYSIVIL